ncbi:MAG: hypothetical protein JOZ65_07150 [Chloroflexi bacterium]|nr:hypothetical protein [Chloroflexota bacterium]
MRGSYRSACFGLVAVIVFSSLGGGSAAVANGDSLTELMQAQSRSAALASAATSASVQLALTTASTELSSATA